MPAPIQPSVYYLEELSAHSSEATILAARALLLEYGQFVAAQPGVAHFCYGALEQESATLPQSYLTQGGGALIALLPSQPARHQPAGFVAWRTLATLTHAWELKRLWLRPEARGLRIGQALVQAVIDRARAARQSTLFLDTEPNSMASAHRLYLRMGFEPCPPYNGPAAPGILYMRKNL